MKNSMWDNYKEKTVVSHEWEGETICNDCGEPCSLIWEDQGIGPYEYFGALGTHVDWCEVTDCCGCEEHHEFDLEEDCPELCELSEIDSSVVGSVIQKYGDLITLN